MKSRTHCAVQAILNASSTRAVRVSTWEARQIGTIGTRFAFKDRRDPRSYLFESIIPNMGYDFSTMRYDPADEYFEKPILELYGSRRPEGILGHVYQQVKHLIEPVYHRACSAFDPFFDGSFSYSVREWCRMMYPIDNTNIVPQEVLDQMAKTGCFGEGWLDHRDVLRPQGNLKMKQEFEFNKHKSNSKRKHYYGNI